MDLASAGQLLGELAAGKGEDGGRVLGEAQQPAASEAVDRLPRDQRAAGRLPGPAGLTDAAGAGEDGGAGQQDDQPSRMAGVMSVKLASDFAEGLAQGGEVDAFPRRR
jgi:hypothetical protein